MTFRIEVHRGRSRSGTSANGAAISVVANGSYIYYYLSAAALAIAQNWTSGYQVAFEIDDETRQPIAIHFTPATGRGFKLRQGRTGRPYLYVPTSMVGTPDHSGGLLPVLELAISEQEISIQLPFRFRLNGTAPAAVEVADVR
jgi:hypothetical protein